jgi:hypothetical protein
LRDTPQEDHTYIDGLYKLGNDIVAKKRVPEFEVDKKHLWSSNTRQDIWKSTMHISQSLRTKQMDDLMQADPVYDHFSENKYLDHYHKPNVKTGSVDHIIPFKHSHNKTAQKMNHLRPDFNKNYPYSNNEQLLNPTLTRNKMMDSINVLPGAGDISPKAQPAVPSPEHSSKLKPALHQTSPAVPKPPAITEESRERPTTSGESRGPHISNSSYGSLSRKLGGKGYRHKEVHKTTENEKIDKLLKVYFK